MKVCAQLFAVRHNLQAVQVSAVQGRHIRYEGDTEGKQGAAWGSLRHEDLSDGMGYHLCRRRSQRYRIMLCTCICAVLLYGMAKTRPLAI